MTFDHTLVPDELRAPAARYYVPAGADPSDVLDRRAATDLCGERRLLLAVLEDALAAIRFGATDWSGRRTEKASREIDWFESQSRARLFDFESICDHLGFDADYLRRQVRRLIEQPVQGWSGAQARALREKLGETQHAFAHRLGCAPSMPGCWETGFQGVPRRLWAALDRLSAEVSGSAGVASA